jgi:hypothetical protein
VINPEAFSMPLRFRWVSVLGSLLVFCPQADVSGWEPKQEISILVCQLGSTVFQTREVAMKRLIAIGEPALEELNQSADNSRDPEVRQRVNAVIEMVRENAALSNLRKLNGKWKLEQFEVGGKVVPCDEWLTIDGATYTLTLQDGSECTYALYPYKRGAQHFLERRLLTTKGMSGERVRGLVTVAHCLVVIEGDRLTLGEKGNPMWTPPDSLAASRARMVYRRSASSK